MDNNNTFTTSEKVAITFTLPNPKVAVLKFRDKIIHLLSVIYNPLRNGAQATGDTINSGVRRFRVPRPRFNWFKFNKKKAIKIIFPIIIVVVIIGGAVAFIKRAPDASTTVPDQQVMGDSIVASRDLNKVMNFPINDEKGKEVGKFEYTITSVELRKKIIVQGRNATAISGRVFLIFNLKIKNNNNLQLKLNTRDYIRITVASNPSEKLAADIHNDPVEVQAISTKYTRVGLAINEEDSKKPIHLQIGEIDGPKQDVELKFN